jgi:hypothetical protein
MKYVKESPRLTVKFIDANTEDELFEIKDRSWMNIGEIFSDHVATSLIERELKERKKSLPKKILLLAVAELTLE